MLVKKRACNRSLPANKSAIATDSDDQTLKQKRKQKTKTHHWVNIYPKAFLMHAGHSFPWESLFDEEYFLTFTVLKTKHILHAVNKCHAKKSECL